jgi:circadian clock protein KaiB
LVALDPISVLTDLGSPVQEKTMLSRFANSLKLSGVTAVATEWVRERHRAVVSADKFWLTDARLGCVIRARAETGAEFWIWSGREAVRPGGMWEPAITGSGLQLKEDQWVMEKYVIRLYVLGETQIARRAIENLRAICADRDVDAVYAAEVINLLDHPQLAEDEQIVATPLLVRKLPPPELRIIGDLSDREKVLIDLGIKPRTW